MGGEIGHRAEGASEVVAAGEFHGVNMGQISQSHRTTEPQNFKAAEDRSQRSEV